MTGHCTARDNQLHHEQHTLSIHKNAPNVGGASSTNWTRAADENGAKLGTKTANSLKKLYFLLADLLQDTAVFLFSLFLSSRQCKLI